MENTISILNSLGVAVVTGWVTVVLAFRRYKSEKWWDRKSQCYCETVDALNEIMVVCDAFIDEKVHGLILQKNEQLELSQRFRKGKQFCFTQINIGQLLMSHEAHSTLRRFESALSSVEREEPRDTVWEAIRETTEGYIDMFIPFARKDLGAHSNWSTASFWVKRRLKRD